MRRSALRVFFQRVLPVALPLLTGGCVGGGTCPSLSVTVAVDGGVPPGGLTDAGCASYCFDGIHTQTGMGGGISIERCEVQGTAVACTYHTDCHTGRRPAGFVAVEQKALARMAELEAASVHAFDMLACELHEHGAPAHLIADAKRAARDEARHARLMGTLAGRRARVSRPVRVARSLEAIAIENVVEGCVREAFGAAVAQLEAHHHPDPAMREAMRAIYPDEERHAELAFAVDAWIRPRLGRAARRRVDAARRGALGELALQQPQLRPLVDELAAL